MLEPRDPGLEVLKFPLRGGYVVDEGIEGGFELVDLPAHAGHAGLEGPQLVGDTALKNKEMPTRDPPSAAGRIETVFVHTLQP